ncbi:probable WD repeat-containing protein jip5 [Rhynchosporium secalis]|uniref:WD repeat-containing protein JIP5 n=1 Tax=Rhynchosporium secalis TaxID=38038 RepID=A0A1E1LUK8_RHYSE|nr:probable WD repeat-containing protein jip5 [Rhynchosporium secalis]
MFENLCTLPLSSELFTQVTHPTEPILAVGLSGGHVESFRLPAVGGSSSDEDDADTSVISTGTSTIDTEWRTRRHKGSCRTLAYSGDGEVLYSAGTDGLLKAANSSTGQVTSKINIPFDFSGKLDPPTLIHALTPQTLLLATDSAALHLFDLRLASTLSPKPSQTHRPHDDYISSLTPLPPTETSTSGFSKQWVTTGGTTLAVTDLRRGVLVKSEDQEEELLSSVYVGGLPSRPGRSKGQKVLVGSSNGVLTLWERGVWDDQDERIIVDGGRGGGESLDALVLMPEGVGDGGKNVVVGVGDGTIRIVKLGPNKVTVSLRHDEVEGVVGLGFDVEGRLISGGGSIIKVWQEKMNLEEESEEDDSDDESGAKKRSAAGSNSDDSDVESSEEEDRGRKSRKKRRKANRNKYVGSGIIGLKGLE